jgi:Doubled CXXCH motif (Paired_CXXCH_1)
MQYISEVLLRLSLLRFYILIIIGFFFALGLNAQGIVGSRHDFTSSGWNWNFMHKGTEEICIVCHTPHTADTTVIDSPLWNHEVTSSTFTLYSSSTFNAALVIGQPEGVSKLCLSCHDGTVALDSWGNLGGTVSGGGHSWIQGTNLSNDHPISFTYDSTLASVDGELHNPNNTPSGLGNTIANDLLSIGRVECTSCHDVHNKMGNSTILSTTNNHMLWKKNTGSALCLTCHDK